MSGRVCAPHGQLGRRSPCSRQRPCRDDAAGHRRARRRRNARPRRARRQHPRSPPAPRPVPRASRSGSSAAADVGISCPRSASRLAVPIAPRRHPGSASARRVHRPLLPHQKPSPRTETTAAGAVTRDGDRTSLRTGDGESAVCWPQAEKMKRSASWPSGGALTVSSRSSRGSVISNSRNEQHFRSASASVSTRVFSSSSEANV
jgi:hypothetical protein